MRDACVLCMLALLDLESNPLLAAIDWMIVGVDVIEGCMLQFGLFARALPSDKFAMLLARLGAFMGSNCVGALSLVDMYRSGVFAMAKFDLLRSFTPFCLRVFELGTLRQAMSVLRRFRFPIPVRVMVDHRHP